MTNILPIAQNVIDICGGADVVANWLNITSVSVHRWKYDKSKGGTGGLVPSKYHQVLITKAKENSKKLSPHHFFDLGTPRPKSPPKERPRA